MFYYTRRLLDVVYDTMHLMSKIFYQFHIFHESFIFIIYRFNKYLIYHI